jgi:MATE family multidrug resistance protein
VTSTAPPQNPPELPAAAKAANSGAESSWWLRPCGGREVLTLALPLVIQTAFWSVMWFVDRMFLLWYSPDAMAASLPAGMFHWTMICLPSGIASFVNTFVAQYYGAGRHRRIGVAVNQGIWFGWATVPLFLLAIPLSPWLFAGGSYSREIEQMEIVYFQSLAWGAGAVVISNAQSSFYTGRGLTGIVMVVNLVSCCIDILLNYAMIFGKLGSPELGIAGAGWSTSIGEWCTVLIFWVLMRRRADREQFGLDDNHFDWPLFRRLLKFGFPAGLPQLVESAAFSVLIMYVSAIGLVAGAATTLAFNVNAVAFVPMIGVSIAVSTLVGQKLGENQPELAARATWTGLVMGLAYTGLFAVLYVAAPDWFLVAHAARSDPQAFAPIRDATVVLLRFVALYCLFDSMQIVFVGALKGAGDTRFILINATLISIAALLVGRTLQDACEWKETGFALYGWWWVMTGWIFALGISYLLRFEQGRWKSIRVIEPELPDAQSV